MTDKLKEKINLNGGYHLRQNIANSSRKLSFRFIHYILVKARYGRALFFYLRFKFFDSLIHSGLFREMGSFNWMSEHE